MDPFPSFARPIFGTAKSTEQNTNITQRSSYHFSRQIGYLQDFAYVSIYIFTTNCEIIRMKMVGGFFWRVNLYRLIPIVSSLKDMQYQNAYRF